MIDSIALVWGGKIGSTPRRARGYAEPVADPVRLDLRGLHERFSEQAIGGDGELTYKRYTGSESAEHIAGHWKVGDLEVLYQPGRLELRASLPKVVTGGFNDELLDERGVHHGLREIVRQGAELVEHPLDLREAVPTRIDHVIQWQVPSVAFCVEHLRAAYAPPRKVRTEWVTPLGGRSIIWGYGGKHVLRFYDKGADVAEKLARELAGRHDLPFNELAAMSEADRRQAIKYARQKFREKVWREAELDTTLRFEIQDRRPGRIRSIHELGYRASDVRAELSRTIAVLGEVSQRDIVALVEEYSPAFPYRVHLVGSALWFSEHEADLVALYRHGVIARNAYYRWKQKAREVKLAVGEWAPAVPDDAFSSGSTLWADEERVA